MLLRWQHLQAIVLLVISARLELQIPLNLCARLGSFVSLVPALVLFVRQAAFALPLV